MAKKKKSDGARNTDSQTIKQVLNKPPIYPNFFGKKQTKVNTKIFTLTVRCTIVVLRTQFSCAMKDYY